MLLQKFYPVLCKNFYRMVNLFCAYQWTHVDVDFFQIPDIIGKRHSLNFYREDIVLQNNYPKKPYQTM